MNALQQNPRLQRWCLGCVCDAEHNAVERGTTAPSGNSCDVIFAGRPLRSAGGALISNAPRGPSCRIVIDRVELPVSDRLKRRTMKSVAWFKITRLLGPLRDLPSAEFETQYCRSVSASAEPALK